jgi:hypothetical protein
MVYGKEKVRDMSRSLLPSTKRKGARDARDQLHREARRTARLELARLQHEPEAFEDLPRPDGGRSPEIGHMVRRRRSADKVTPFIRWATATTRELPRESRLSHIQGLLPKGVIGEHALSHLKDAESFRDPWEDTWRRAWLRRRPQSEWMDRGAQAELLRAVLAAPGGHRAFNRWLQTRHTGFDNLTYQPTRARTLHGAHDVLPFLDEVGEYTQWYSGKRAWQPRFPNPEPFEAMEAFLRAFKQCRGDVEATLKALEKKRPAATEPERRAAPRQGALHHRCGPAL